MAKTKSPPGGGYQMVEACRQALAERGLGADGRRMKYLLRLSVWVERELRVWLEREAKRNGVSLSVEARNRIYQSFRQYGAGDALLDAWLRSKRESWGSFHGRPDGVDGS